MVGGATNKKILNLNEFQNEIIWFPQSTQPECANTYSFNGSLTKTIEGEFSQYIYLGSVSATDSVSMNSVCLLSVFFFICFRLPVVCRIKLESFIPEFTANRWRSRDQSFKSL